ncbi:uncharacterized protein TNCV_5114991 [Trichonephila clavipes]|nr:uncharacterized protein TNCV_5114991 [Trichonephila clavipes]
MITNFFIPELNNHDVQELWFQQDGATCHAARATIDLLKDTFGDRLISRFGPVNWPPRSCDLTPLDYFLWGYVKSLVYADKPQTLDHSEDNIRRVIADIRPQMLEKVIENWTSRLDYIRASRGSPMPEIIFKIPTQPASSTPSSPQGHRRSLSYMSPTTARRCHHPSSSPPTTGRPLPLQPLPCSDDSSTSSLQDTLERKSPPKRPPRRTSRDAATSSDEEIENSDDESFKRMPRRSVERKELVFKDTVPSSWKYSPGFPRKEYTQQPVTVAFGTGMQRKLSDGHSSSRLPALTPRTENKQPPKVGKVSPRPHYQQNWNEHRSQSSEDLYQTPSSGPVQNRNLIFHSRGPSPVNTKGRNPADSSFRRNDPKRHSSPRINQRSNVKMQLSPPKFLSRAPVMQQNVRNVQNGQPARRMFWSPERPSQPKTMLQRKNSVPSPEKIASPVVEKLLQHSDLCTDKNFIEKIEQLIAEFQSKTKFDESDDYGVIQYNSLPVNLEEVDSKPLHLQPKKSPVENNPGKSPSKIPLPTWYSKCQS